MSLVRRRFLPSWGRCLFGRTVIRHMSMGTMAPEYGQPTSWTHPHLFEPYVRPDSCIPLERYTTPGIPQEEYENRRRRLMECVEPGTIILLQGHDLTQQTRDINYPFRQQSDVYYLTGILEPSVIVALVKDYEGEETFSAFVAKKSLEYETWHGPVTGVEATARYFECDEALELEPMSLANFLKDTLHRLLSQPASEPMDGEGKGKGEGVSQRIPAVFYTVPQQMRLPREVQLGITHQSPCGKSLIFPHWSHFVAHILEHECPVSYVLGKGDQLRLGRIMDENTFAAQIKARDKTKRRKVIRSSDSLLMTLRHQKSHWDLSMFLRSASITAIAFKEGMRQSLLAASGSVTEGDVFNAIQHTAMKHGGNCHLAYIPVVAGGKRATSLHYISNNRVLKGDELLLVDAGADFYYYPTDCTRTWPVSGKFTQGQRQVYEAVYRVQRRLLAEMRVGVNVGKLSDYACQLIATELLHLGILNRNDPPHVIEKTTAFLYPHNWGHFMGLDIHEHPPSQILVPGSMHTVEPGLYFPDPTAIAAQSATLGLQEDWPGFDLKRIPPELYGVGIRIEDNVYITGLDSIGNPVPGEWESASSLTELRSAVTCSGSSWSERVGTLFGDAEQTCSPDVNVLLRDGHLVTTQLLPTAADEIERLLSTLSGRCPG
jgi:intermediate cleaving peptidase 55